MMVPQVVDNYAVTVMIGDKPYSLGPHSISGQTVLSSWTSLIMIALAMSYTMRTFTHALLQHRLQNTAV